MRCAPIHSVHAPAAAVAKLDAIADPKGLLDAHRKTDKEIGQRVLERKTEDDGDDTRGRKDRRDRKVEDERRERRDRDEEVNDAEYVSARRCRKKKRDGTTKRVEPRLATMLLPPGSQMRTHGDGLAVLERALH